MDRVDSPPPTFSEYGSQHGSPRFSEAGTPKFTEHLWAFTSFFDAFSNNDHNRRNTSPPYSQFLDNAEDAPIPRHDSQGLPPHQRLSRKDRSMAAPAEYIEQGPQALNPDSEEKEVIERPTIEPSTQYDHTAHDEKKRRICGLSLVRLLVIVGLILAIAIGLAVGLGVGLSNKKSSGTSINPADTQYMIGGAIDPSYFSTQGAFNGSGIALASQSFAVDLEKCTQGSIVMYFQHWTGQIRSKQLSCTTGQWEGGDISSIVTDQAKNGTAISAVAYSYGGQNSWHIFYIDKNNVLKQRSNSNTTNVWQDGEINQLNAIVMDADMVGMQACWYGNQYGDSDYSHSPSAPDNATTSANATKAQEVGMHMWYAIDNTTFQQLGWRAGDEVWEKQQTFTNMNGHAGVGCYSWGPGTVTYAMFVNTQNTVEFWWKDTATNDTSTVEHPINQWTNSSIAIPNVYPSTSLGYTNAFYVQDAASLQFHGYNISWAAENTSFITSDDFVVSGDPGLPGTHLSVSTIPSGSGGDDLIVFYQTNGSDITEYTRDYVQGQWSNVEVPIPQ